MMDILNNVEKASLIVRKYKQNKDSIKSISRQDLEILINGFYDLYTADIIYNLKDILKDLK